MDEGRKHSLVTESSTLRVVAECISSFYIFSAVKLLFNISHFLFIIWSMKSFHHYAWPWDWEYENMRISRRLSVRRVETVGAADYRFRVYPPCAPLLKGDSAQKYISAGSGSSFSKFNNIYAAKPIHHTLCHCTHFSPQKGGPLSMSGGLLIKLEGNRYPPKSCFICDRT